MPRVSRAQTDKNRASIELVAARLFLEQGIDGVSVAELMGAAGLTHGGFYGHFDSKESLAAIACSKAFEQSEKRRKEKIDGADTPQAALADITDAYLRSEHRDQPGNGCPVSALASDIARDITRETADKPVRAVYLEGVKQMLTSLTKLSADAGAADAERSALQRMAMLVGALTLARATAGDPVSDAFLDAGRAWLAQLGK
ncbi:MAG TPA: TetR/AcrR family transcriptional regulator [Herbaspirillum sp.]|jgi:TetR/AcrR family transcriptional repressor of nem operon